MNIHEDFKAAQRARWAHFAPLQSITTPTAARLVKHAAIRSGMRVLDVACGTGVVAITAARLGAQVAGLDLTPELLAVARDNAHTAQVNVEWQEGDVEHLPYEPAAFDAVLSQFGHIFAPSPNLAIAEMLRVLTPGGTIAFSTWPPEHFVARMMALVGRYAPPPPPGVAPPPQWGDPNIVRERLGAAVRDIVFERATMVVPALSIPHYRQVSERTSGPMVQLVESLGASDPAKLEALRLEFDALVREYFDENLVHQDYLLTRATKIV